MYVVSENYKSQINKTVRNESYLKVNFGIVNSNASNNYASSDSDSLFFSNSNAINSGYNVDKKYMTFERNKFVLDGNGLLPPEVGSEISYYQGYVSNSISGEDCVFSTPPKVIITFPTYYSFYGLTFRFDKVFNLYPSELQIIAYNDSTEVYNGTKYPTSADFVWQEGIPTNELLCNKIEIIFKKSNLPHRRAELEYVMFGIVATFTDNDITEATWSREVDLLSAKLPKNSFEFTILDPNKNYDPENPSGIWQYLEDRQPVWFQYGYTLDDGAVEWIDGSTVYSVGEVKLNSNNVLSTVTFTAKSTLETLENFYYKGAYNPAGATLYDLAVAVLEYANLPLLKDGIVPYVVDASLQNIITKIPLPQKSIKELLQLIANAGMCVLSCNRIGQIQIAPVNPAVSDFKFDFNNIKNAPMLVKSPYLLQVDTYSNNVTVQSDFTEIHRSTIDFTVDTECLLTYDMSAEVSLGVGAGVTVIGTPQYFANCCLVTLNGSGTISLTGKKLVFSKNSVTYVAGETGYICPIENELINSPTDAYNYAQWVASILTRRNIYTIEDRGYPEVDMGDLILTDTLFTTDMQSTVTASKLKYNGALSGETTYLSKEV